jgi:hypothetical protein
MKASISFPELQNIIAERANQQIALAFVDRKTIRVSYPLNLGFIKKDISANLIIKELVGSDLLLQLDAGFGSDTMLNTMLSLLKDKIPAGLIEKCPDSQLLVHLSQIENLQSLFDNIDITDLHVLTEGLEVEGALK